MASAPAAAEAGEGRDRRGAPLPVAGDGVAASRRAPRTRRRRFATLACASTAALPPVLDKAAPGLDALDKHNVLTELDDGATGRPLNSHPIADGASEGDDIGCVSGGEETETEGVSPPPPPPPPPPLPLLAEQEQGEEQERDVVVDEAVATEDQIDAVGTADGEAGALNLGLVPLRLSVRAAVFGREALVTGAYAAKAVYDALPPPFPGPAKTHEPPFENVLNVITSLPFLWLGIKHFPRDTAKRRRFANGIFAVGCASMLFHSSSGHVRPHTRRLDFVSIAVNTTHLSACVRPQLPGAVRAVALALAPAFPLPVTAAQTAVIEHEFAQAAIKDDAIRRKHISHVLSSVFSVACWLGEDASWGHWIMHPVSVDGHACEPACAPQARAGRSGQEVPRVVERTHQLAPSRARQRSAQ